MNFNKKRPKIELSMRYSFWLGMIVVMICSLYILFVECFSVEGLENLEREDDYCLAYYSQNSSFFAGMKTNIYHSGN